MTNQLLPFLAVVAVISVTPGPDTALVLSNTFKGGARAGLVTALGCCIGLLIWGIASAVGLATVMRASSNLFGVIRVIGGIYLTWLGVRMIWGARRYTDVSIGAQSTSQQAMGGRRPLAEGLLSDLLNPKAAAFFTALLPQFVTSSDAVLATTLLMAVIVSVAAFVGLLAYTLLASLARSVLDRPRIRRRLDEVTGLVLVGLGVHMLAREGRA
jgi:threonine/homoserine/homoserine lactone efflux protein